MWGRQTEKASALESAVHTQRIGQRLYFIICLHCQQMQVKTETMSAFSLFLTLCGIHCEHHTRQSECLDLVALSLSVSVCVCLCVCVHTPMCPCFCLFDVC